MQGDPIELPQQTASRGVHLHLAPGRAGGVHHYARLPHRAPAHPADPGQKLGELEHPIAKRCHLGAVREEARIVMVHHAAAGARQHHHRPGLGEERHLALRHLARLLLVTRGIGRLAAAGLFLDKVHPYPFPLEQGDGIEPRHRVEQVHQTGGVDIDIGRLGRIDPHYLHHLLSFTSTAAVRPRRGSCT